jgi:Putative threonine efflux protein
MRGKLASSFSAITNPKALLFFAAFLPQFIDPHRNLVVPFAVMAGRSEPSSSSTN